MKIADIKKAEKAIICNQYHSGNRSLVYSAGRGLHVWTCQGCNTHHTLEAVDDAWQGAAGEYIGSGGVVRVK